MLIRASTWAIGLLLLQRLSFSLWHHFLWVSEPQLSAILSRAVSGASTRLLFVSTMCPFWIISSRMMWTRSRLNMIWWRLRVKETHTHTNTPDVYVSDRKCWLIVMVTDSRWERIRPVHSVETNRDTVIRLEDEQDNKRDAATIRCIQTHHPAEVFIQNLHKVMNQLVDGQLVLRRQTLSEYFHFMPHLICKPKSHWQWTTSSVQNPREEKRYNYKKSILNHFLCKNISHFYFLIMRQEPKTKRFSIVWLLMKKHLQEIKEKHPKIQWCYDSSSCNNRCRLRLLDISELSAACTSQIQLYV